MVHLRFYRVYLLDIDGSIEATELVAASDDAEVYEAIKKRGCAQTVEIWDGRRRVGLIGRMPPRAEATAVITNMAA